MNAYDFDGTIYAGDSSTDFVLYCFRRYPRLARRLPRMAAAAVRYGLHLVDKTSMKAVFFGFLPLVPNIDEVIVSFWDAHIGKVMPWYRAVARPDDVIISASPEFLLEEACARLGITTLIASEVRKDTGEFFSPNCHDSEKVRRLEELMPGVEIENFYSDSRSDEPMAKRAHHAWLIRKGAPVPW